MNYFLVCDKENNSMPMKELTEHAWQYSEESGCLECICGARIYECSIKEILQGFLDKEVR